MNEEKIAQLEAQLTGDMFADMDIKDQIHKLKLEEAAVILMILIVKPVGLRSFSIGYLQCQCQLIP
jgi:hypothetical protein